MEILWISMIMTWNPRYIQYARWHGELPEEMRVIDRHGPGGLNWPYMHWITVKWREFRKEFEIPENLSPHKKFDCWLEDKVNKRIQAVEPRLF